MNNFNISARLVALLAMLCGLILLVGAIGLYGMNASNSGLKSVYDDRVVPLKQLKDVADMYAVNVVDSAHKVRDGAMTAAQGSQAIADARKGIEANWKAYLATADKAVDALQGHFQSGDTAALTAFAAKELYPATDPLQSVLGKLIVVQLEHASTSLG